MINYDRDINNIVLIVFAFLFSGYVTARSIVPGVGFTLLAILWLLYGLPFYYHKKIIFVNDTNFFVLLFLFLVMISGSLNFGEKFSNQVVINLAGSVAMYFILISLMDSYDIIKKMILINIIIAIPIVIVYSLRSWYGFNSLWLSPYWNNNYAFGKNVVGVFTVFCFNYLYSYYMQKKSITKFFGLVILFLTTIYTISRGALISLVIVFLFTPIIAKNKKSHIYILSTLVALYFPAVHITNYNPLNAYLEIKNRGSAAQLGYDYEKSNSTKFYNFRNRNSPGAKYGLSRRASHFITTKNNFFDKPLFGSGSGSFRRQEGTLAHSDYLTILFEYGLIGLVIFLIMGFQHFYHLIKFRNKIPPSYRWVLDATVVQIIILAFTFFTIDAYMVPFTWYVLAIASSIVHMHMHNFQNISTNDID